MADNKNSRRGFLEIILGGSALATLGAVFYPVTKYLVPPATAEANLSQLKLPFTRADIEADDKKAKYFKYGRDLGIVFVTASGKRRKRSAISSGLLK